MALTYFTGLSDVNLSKDALAKTPNLYIQKFEFEGTGVLNLTVPATATLTPAVSPAWTIDEFNSSQAVNLQVIDDNGVVAVVKIDDTSATTITFDATDLFLESDGTTAATLTTTVTYQFRILTPSNNSIYGPFFGYTEGAELSLSDEFMEFKYSTPRKLIFSDLLERAGEITGGQVSFDNEDVIQTIFGSEQYGLQTAQYSQGIGSDPDTNRFYKLVFATEDRVGRALTFVVRRCQFRSNGNIMTNAESGHKMIQFTANIISDNFYPENADMMQITRSDA